MPPPSAFSAPQYYTPEQQHQQQNYQPMPGNMYNGGMNNGPPPHMAGGPPPNAMGTPPVTHSPQPITPAVRKMDIDSDTPGEKKPRLDTEPEWQAPQVVSSHKTYTLYEMSH
jgi:hypothetical protein